MSIADKLTTIAENEQKVYDAGYLKGKAEGGDTETAYNEGVEAGKQAELMRFWKAYQRPSYNPFRLKYAGSTWNATTFTPQYTDFVKGTGKQMFLQNAVPNIKEAYAKTGCVLDISACTNGEQMFANSMTQELGIMDMSLLTATNTTLEMYAYNPGLWKIEKIICVAKTLFANSTFGGLSNLQYIRFEGEIGTTINFQACTKLTKESIESVITHLSDTASGKTATFSLTAVQKAFETSSGANDGNTSEEWDSLTTTKTNWNISLV